MGAIVPCRGLGSRNTVGPRAVCVDSLLSDLDGGAPRPDRRSPAEPSAPPGSHMTRPLALRILALAAAIGPPAQGLLLGNLLGLNVPILSVALLAAASAVRPAGRRIDPLDRWLPPAAIAMSIAVAV